MREIKFRAWDKNTKEMSYFGLSDLTMPASEHYLRHTDNVDMMPLKPVMQYTGLKDKNGKEPYHFDIVLNSRFKWIIEWGENEGGWILTKRKGDRIFHKNLTSTTGFEVIGNIYENGDLLRYKCRDCGHRTVKPKEMVETIHTIPAEHIKSKPGKVLVIPDTHFPFEHFGSLEHCRDVYNKHQCTKVVCIGDLIDHHRISRHVSEPDADGAKLEKAKTVSVIRLWGNVFPNMSILLGNHDLIPYRQAKEMGIPASFLRRLSEVYEMPIGWTFHKRLIYNNVIYLHDAGGGKYAAINKAKDMSMSVVAGHAHRHGGIMYFSNPTQLFFGMNAGCLIDKETYAMRYSHTEPTLGCCVVVDKSEAYFIPMRLS